MSKLLLILALIGSSSFASDFEVEITHKQQVLRLLMASPLVKAAIANACIETVGGLQVSEVTRAVPEGTGEEMAYRFSAKFVCGENLGEGTTQGLFIITGAIFGNGYLPFYTIEMSTAG